METRSQLDLIVNSLILIRKASSAVDTALGLPAADRAELEGHLDAVRHDVSRLLNQVGGAIPGAKGLGKRPEVKVAAGIVEFVARQSASQLGAVAGVADALRAGGDSRSLAQRIERHLAEVGVASREDLAAAVGADPESTQLQEAIERALGSGRAEWYGPGVYGVPRSQLEEIGARPPEETPADAGEATAEPEAMPTGREHLQSAIDALEGSLGTLGAALHSAGSGRSSSEQIRELRRLADEGVIDSDEYERKKREILSRM